MDIKHILSKSIAELRKVDIPTPELDVKVLLAASLNKDSVFLHSHSEVLPTNSEYSKFRKFIRRRKKLEPIAYILGHKEFYNTEFFVNKNVLIPRPETEFLVEKTIEILKQKFSENIHQSLSVLDMGTGSGCIIISIAKYLLDHGYPIDNIRFCATDISDKALYVARKNAKKFNLNKNIKFYKSDLFSNKKLPKDFDIIVANLPYVPIETKSKSKASIDFEPQSAIFAKNNGKEVILRFFNQVISNIKVSNIIIEFDIRNASEILSAAKKIFPKASIKSKKDLANLARYLLITL